MNNPTCPNRRSAATSCAPDATSGPLRQHSATYNQRLPGEPPFQAPVPTLVIHGGASGGTLPPDIPPHLEASYRHSLARALHRGYRVLQHGGSSLDAVTEAVSVLEDDELFNAAHGAVFNRRGDVECEASVMVSSPPPASFTHTASAESHELTDSRTPSLKHHHARSPVVPQSRRYVAVTLVRDTKNPIRLARILYLNPRRAPHCFFSGREAERIGWKLGLKRVNGRRYYWTKRRWQEHLDALHEHAEDGGEVESDEAGTSDADDESDSGKAEGHPQGDAEDQQRKRECRSGRYAEEPLPMYQPRCGGVDVVGTSETNDAEDVTRASAQPLSADGDDDGRAATTRLVQVHLQGDARHESDRPRRREFLPMGTVGAVAIDARGAVACATSTGGLTNKTPGRIGDTPSVGAGFWAETWDVERGEGTHRVRRHTRRRGGGKTAREGEKGEDDEDDDDDDEGTSSAGCLGSLAATLGRVLPGRHLARRLSLQATGADAEAIGQRPRESPPSRQASLAISATGTGDYFLRASFASQAVHRRRFLLAGPSSLGGSSSTTTAEACSAALDEVGALGGEGGAIGVDEGAEVWFGCNTQAMNRGYISARTCHQARVAIWAEEVPSVVAHKHVEKENEGEKVDREQGV